jgi:hypothetical protein
MIRKSKRGWLNRAHARDGTRHSVVRTIPTTAPAARQDDPSSQRSSTPATVRLHVHRREGDSHIMKRTWTWNPAKGREALQKTLQQVGRAAADYMADQCREYAHEDTGALKASIGVVDETGGFTYQVICAVPYAVYQEFGWFDVSLGLHPPVAMLRHAIADTQERFPQIAVQFRIGGPNRIDVPKKIPAQDWST